MKEDLSYPDGCEKLREESGIRLGVPVYSQNFSGIRIPNNPHVFLCKEITLYRPFGYGKLKLGDPLKNIFAILGHGLSVKDERRWVFAGTSKPVDQTVRTYESFAEANNLPQLDIVIACLTSRPTTVPDAQGQHIPFEKGNYAYIVSGSVVHVLNDEVPAHLVQGQGAIMAVKSYWSDPLIWKRDRYD